MHLLRVLVTYQHCVQLFNRNSLDSVTVDRSKNIPDHDVRIRVSRFALRFGV